MVKNREGFASRGGGGTKTEPRYGRVFCPRSWRRRKSEVNVDRKRRKAESEGIVQILNSLQSKGNRKSGNLDGPDQESCLARSDYASGRKPILKYRWPDLSEIDTSLVES